MHVEKNIQEMKHDIVDMQLKSVDETDCEMGENFVIIYMESFIWRKLKPFFLLCRHVCFLAPETQKQPETLNWPIMTTT